MLRYTIPCTALSLAMVPLAASAETTLPNSGIYATPSCTSSENATVIVAGTEFVIDDMVFRTPLAEESSPVPGGWLQHSDGYYTRATATGYDTAVWSPDDNDAPLPRDLAATLPDATNSPHPAWQMTSYVQCDRVPAPHSLIFGETANMLLDLEPAKTDCETGNEACMHKVFAAIDHHPDDQLTTAELARLIRVTMTIGAAVDGTSSTKDIAGYTLASLPLAPIAAKALIASYDYDGNGRLSFGELTTELAGGGLPVGSVDGDDAQARIQDAVTQIQNGLFGLAPLLGGGMR